jgi:hypothetical protein
MLLLAFAERYAAMIGIVCLGVLGVAVAAAAGLLPEQPLAAAAVGYLIYSLGAGAATVALLGVSLLLDRDA